MSIFPAFTIKFPPSLCLPTPTGGTTNPLLRHSPSRTHYPLAQTRPSPLLPCDKPSLNLPPPQTQPLPCHKHYPNPQPFVVNPTKSTPSPILSPPIQSFPPPPLNPHQPSPPSHQPQPPNPVPPLPLPLFSLLLWARINTPNEINGCHQFYGQMLCLFGLGFVITGYETMDADLRGAPMTLEFMIYSFILLKSFSLLKGGIIWALVVGWWRKGGQMLGYRPWMELEECEREGG